MNFQNCGSATGTVLVAAGCLVPRLLFQTSASDPITFATSVAVFHPVSMLASYLPAGRVASIDPTGAP
jgi:hypothetical protein